MPPTQTVTDPILCRCLKVTESTVRDCVTLYGAESIQEVKQACGAGTGCMACRRRILDMIKQGSCSQQRLETI